MGDIVDSETRSRMMRGIRGKDTGPEVTLRKYLHSLGYRFRLHRCDLPGSPDLVLHRYRLAIFVHGCFWHRHEDCFYATTPLTRKEFWEEKFRANVSRDSNACAELQRQGWRVLVVWECGLKHCAEELADISEMIRSEGRFLVWPGSPPRVRGS